MKNFFVTLLVGFSMAASAQRSEVFIRRDAAINGYDPVAYFTQGKPVKGSESFEVVWKDAKWFFSSQSNAQLFKNNPEKYAPQYGGYCAYGCARGYKVKSEPDAWSIVNGKLYLNYSLSIRDTWNKDQKTYIEKADKNWPTVKTSD
jgi:YHS domain-containing protein